MINTSWVKKTVLVLALLFSPLFFIGAQESGISSEDSFEAHLILEGQSLRYPWGMAFLPGGDLLITLREGRMVIFRDGSLSEVTGVPRVDPAGQGGLLDVAAHPYARDGQPVRIFFTYTTRSSGGWGTRMGTALLLREEDGGARLTNFQELFSLPRDTETTRHFGSRLLFDNAGYLYMSIGDRGERHRAQDKSDPAGSVLRFSPPVSRDDPKQVPREYEIFTTGHRNIQGLALHPETGEIWAHEHGPQGGDEVNILREGKNYGWPVVSRGREYGSGAEIGAETMRGIEEPLVVWIPSIAPSGMAFYQGDLFVGALAGKHLRRIHLEGSAPQEQDVLFLNRWGRIRDVALGPDGALYLLTDSAAGQLVQLTLRE